VNRIAIVTDSTANLPPEVVEKHNIHVPLAEDAEASVAIFLAHELSGTVEAAQIVQRLAPTLPLHMVQQFPFCSRDFQIAHIVPRKTPCAIWKSRLRLAFSPLTGIAARG